MTNIEHLLQILGEEGCEISQMVSKCNRFGLNERNVLNPSGPSNAQRLVDEMNDLLAVAEMLMNAGVIPVGWQSSDKQETKKQKVLQFMNYSRSLGTIKDV